MNQLIEKYITNNYYELLKISKKITNNHPLSKDLLHECIIQLYDKESIQLKEYTNEQIKYFIVSILRTNWHSKTSPFYYKIRREFTLYNELHPNFDIPQDDIQRKFEEELIYTILEVSWTELDFFHKTIMEMYLTLGSMNKVSKKTKIPISSIRRYVKEGKETIKNNFTSGSLDF